MFYRELTNPESRCWFTDAVSDANGFEPIEGDTFWVRAPDTQLGWDWTLYAFVSADVEMQIVRSATFIEAYNLEKTKMSQEYSAKTFFEEVNSCMPANEEYLENSKVHQSVLLIVKAMKHSGYSKQECYKHVDRLSPVTRGFTDHCYDL
jgi:hypothetical protein